MIKIDLVRPLWILCLFAGLAFTGCQSTQTIRFDPDHETDLDDELFHVVKLDNGVQGHHLAEPLTNLRFGVGDVLQIEIIGQPASQANCIVMPDGLIFYDLAGGVLAENRTAGELEGVLTERLQGQGEYRDPIVSVNLAHAGSLSYTILGQVGSPGSYPVAKPTRLLEAIATAGGVNDYADLRRSMVIRNNQMIAPDFEALIEDGDMSQNLFLRPGDYVFVPVLGTDKVHVLGQVAGPTSLPFEPRITLIEAIVSAGGPTTDAALSRVSVVRGSAQAPRIAVVDLKDIMTGKRTDFRLQPDDIIWVPTSPWAKIEEYAETAVRTAVSTLTNRAVRETYR